MAFSKTEVDRRVGGQYAEIYAHDGASAQTIPVGASYTKSNGFTDDGLSSNCTPDSTNDKITITQPGVYKIECSLSFTATGNGINWFGAVFADGVEIDKIHFERKIGVGGDYGSTQFGGLYEVTTAPVDLDVRFRHDDAVTDRDITIKYANLNVTGIGV